MLVSIIIPTFNREKTICAVVESALAQTYTDIEVIVVDDGSTDGTASVLKVYGDRIHLVSQANAGPSAARNRGVGESSGEVLAFLDSDDFWLPEKIEKQIQLFEAGGLDICCVICSATIKDSEDRILGNTFDLSGLRLPFDAGIWSNPQEVLATRFILFNQVVAIRRSCFERVGGFNEKLRLLEDYELAMRLSVIGPWGIIKAPLVTKYNDDDGIGVGCMANEDKHLRACMDVIGGITTADHGLNETAKRHLKTALFEMHRETKAREAIRRGGLFSIQGRVQVVILRLKKSLRRRLPSWPKPEVRPIL